MPTHRETQRHSPLFNRFNASSVLQRSSLAQHQKMLSMLSSSLPAASTVTSILSFRAGQEFLRAVSFAHSPLVSLATQYPD
jgi:hypothetical protein